MGKAPPFWTKGKEFGFHDATSVLLRVLCRKHSSTQKVIWGTQLPNQMEYVHSSFGKWNISMKKYPWSKVIQPVECCPSLENKKQKIWFAYPT